MNEPKLNPLVRSMHTPYLRDYAIALFARHAGDVLPGTLPGGYAAWAHDYAPSERISSPWEEFAASWGYDSIDGVIDRVGEWGEIPAPPGEGAVVLALMNTCLPREQPYRRFHLWLTAGDVADVAARGLFGPRLASKRTIEREETMADENEKTIYKFNWTVRRMGSVDGMFVSTPADMKRYFGEPRVVHFGEILGKHSNVRFEDVKIDDFEVVAAPPGTAEWFEGAVGSTGHDPREYISIRCDACDEWHTHSTCEHRPWAAAGLPGGRRVSTTTVMVVRGNYDVVPLVELRNSHRHGPLAWRNLGAKYLGLEGCYAEQANEVWRLKDDPRITEADFAVLLSTFDRFVCQREHLAAVAALYDEHAKAYADPGHFAVLGEIVRSLIDHDDGYVGFCYQPSSVCDPFWVRRRTVRGETVYRPYNLARDVDEMVDSIAGHFFYDPDEHPAKRVARGELVLVEGGAS